MVRRTMAMAMAIAMAMVSSSRRCVSAWASSGEGAAKLTLPAASSSGTSRTIPTCVAPSVDDFLHGCYQAQTPMVIQGAMNTWASMKWTPDSLKSAFGHLNVPVELSFWNEEQGRWGDYRDLYKDHVPHASSSKEYFTPRQPMALADFIDIFLGERENTSSPPPLIGYMAQHQLLTEVPEMADGIP